MHISGNRKCHLIVVSALSAARDILPPMIIFKGVLTSRYLSTWFFTHFKDVEWNKSLRNQYWDWQQFPAPFSKLLIGINSYYYLFGLYKNVLQTVMFLRSCSSRLNRAPHKFCILLLLLLMLLLLLLKTTGLIVFFRIFRT